MLLVPHVVPPSKLYSAVKPVKADKAGTVSAEVQVFVTLIPDKAGKITALVLTGSQATPSDTTSATVAPHAAVNL